MTIVLNDNTVLGNLCGVNDKNLHYMENIVGTRIFSKGNELHIKSKDEDIQFLFSQLIEELKEHIYKGHSISKDLIQGVWKSIMSGETSELYLLKNKMIDFPNSNTKIFPKSLNQALYIQGMEKSDISFGVGPAGTGKTFLAVAYALEQILTKKIKKLVLTRPIVEAGESLGFLPGDLAQKINPYLRPLYDAMDILVSYDIINKLEENRIIEIAPLAYMRGRSLKDAFIILDEAQNTTKEQMKMFLTRIGEGSRAVITGDITQIDLPTNKKSGLIHALEILRHIPELNFSYFDAEDVVRHPIVKKIIMAYEKNK